MLYFRGFSFEISMCVPSGYASGFGQWLTYFLDTFGFHNLGFLFCDNVHFCVFFCQRFYFMLLLFFVLLQILQFILLWIIFVLFFIKILSSVHIIPCFYVFICFCYFIIVLFYILFILSFLTLCSFGLYFSIEVPPSLCGFRFGL